MLLESLISVGENSVTKGVVALSALFTDEVTALIECKMVKVAQSFE